MTADDIQNDPQLKAQYDRWGKYSAILGNDFSDQQYMDAMNNGDAQFLVDILSPRERVQLSNMLAKDKDFSDGEKCFLAMMLGIPAKTRWIAAVLGISHVAVTKIEQRATGKLEMFKSVSDKSAKDFAKMKNVVAQQSQQAMKDGRYQHKGNISGQGRFAKKD